MRAAAVVTGAAALLACADDGPVRISDSGYGAYEVSLASWPDRLAAAWYDTRDGNAEIYVRRFAPRRTAGAGDLRLSRTAAQSYEADIVAVGDGYAVAWYEKNEHDELRAQLGLWSDQDERRWQLPVSASNYDSRNPVLAAFEQSLFVAWIEADSTGAEHVWARWWDLAGRPAGAPILLADASGTTWSLNAGVDDGGTAYVVFDAAAGTEVEEIFLSRVEHGRSTTQRLTADDGQRSKYPDIALHPHGAALSWYDQRDGNNEIYLYVSDDAGFADGIDSKARRVTATPGDSIGAYVAVNGDSYGLAWSDNSAGSYDVFFQSYDAAGQPLSAIMSISATQSQSLIPAVEAWGTSYALAWNEVDRGARGYHDGDTRSEIFLYIVNP